MNYEEYIKIGLNGDAPLKVILHGSITKSENEKVGVVSVVFATMDKVCAQNRLNDLLALNNGKNDYYMVYSVPLDTDLTKLEHYPSVVISKSDFD